MNATSSIQEPKPMDERTVKINRLKLIAIFGVAVIPVIFAFVMYFGDVAIPSSKTNKGNLIWPPVDISVLDVQQQLPNQLSVKESVLASGKWTLMITGGNSCDQKCKDLIHTVRQVNISMAKEMERVSRALVSSLNGAALAELEGEYPQLVTHYIAQDSIAAFQQAASNNGAKGAQEVQNPWTVWLVDPLGNIILQYTDANDGYDMIADLKRVLKLSNIG